MTDSLVPFLKRFKANLKTNCSEAMQMSVDAMRDHAKTDHVYQDRTGTLTKSMYSKVETDATGVHGIVGNSSEVALWQHEGTGLYGPKGQPFVVVPTEQKALMWEMPGTGEKIFSKKVINPGVKPDPFLARAVHQKKQLFFSAMGGAIRKAAKQSIGKK